MKGVGPASLDKLRALRDAGGWLDAGDYWERFGGLGNRLPFLVCSARVVESFGYCRPEDRDAPPHLQSRVGYRLTDAGRELLEAEEGDSKP